MRRPPKLSILGVAGVALVLALSAAHAQSPETEIETVLGLIEGSPTNALAGEFSSLYFASELHVLTRWAPSQSSADRISASFQDNSPLLQRYLTQSCSTLTPNQKRMLERYAVYRYRSLQRVMAERRAEIIRVFGPGVATSEVGAELSFGDPCDNSASSGPAGILISHRLILAALFSAYFLDSHFLAAPKRAFVEWDAIMPRNRPLSDASVAALLLRIRSMPLFTHHLLALRSMGFGGPHDRDVTPEGLAAESRIPPGQVDEDFFGEMCGGFDKSCSVLARLATLALSERKLSLLLQEQMDFVLAHEIGHQVLGHAKEPLQTCAAELEKEAAADRFAVMLVRPDAGLFTDVPVRQGLRSVQLDYSIASGLELFMLQTHRLATLTDGDQCAYPTFETRLAAARAFDAALLTGR